MPRKLYPSDIFHRATRLSLLRPNQSRPSAFNAAEMGRFFSNYAKSIITADHNVRSRALTTIVVIAICAVLSACMTRGGSSGGGGPIVSFQPRELSFDVQQVGTSSAPESTTLTNPGSSTLTITSITISGDFTETNTCGASLSPGASCDLNVTFTPAVNGTRFGNITIVDNAFNSPQSIVLAGGGAGSTTEQTCTGSATPQTPTDVTSQMDFVNSAAGVDVTQLTNNGCNRFYYFDVPAYSSVVNQIFYLNFVTNFGNQVLMANPDGTNAQIASPTRTGSQAFVSPDGSLLYYAKPIQGGTLGGSDIFGGILNGNPFQEVQITNLDLAPEPPLAVWEISTSSPDPAGGQDIAFSPDTLLHMVHVQANGVALPPSTITLSDPESAATFHRIRLNPKFPNIVMYKRNATNGADPELWLVDLNTCVAGVCPAGNIVNVIANLSGLGPGDVPKAGHVIWSPDGLDIGFSESDIADSWIARNVVNPNGTLNLTNGSIPASSLQQLGPFVSPQLTANYCVFPPNWPAATVLACVSGPGSESNPITFYLMSSDGMGTTKLLSSSDAELLTINGTPLPIFAQDGQHLLFNSDKSGFVQVYLISGFTLTVP
jgi:hypothetical protein